HDWWYDSGFTEATGNAQLDNFGRGGVDGDPIIISAQSGANFGARDNAFMATPADGLSPLTGMFLWSPGIAASLTGPNGPIPSFAVAAPPHVFDLTGNLAIPADATAPNDDACQPVTTDLTGQIALVTFSGVCGSLATVNDLKAAGAIGVVIVDSQLDVPRAFAGSAAANIPTLAIGKSDGNTLKAALANGPV